MQSHFQGHMFWLLGTGGRKNKKRNIQKDLYVPILADMRFAKQNQILSNRNEVHVQRIQPRMKWKANEVNHVVWFVPAKN